jgi:predicted aspartyl protease
MEEVKVLARVGFPGRTLEELEFLVDRGAFYTYLPQGKCDELGIDLIIPHRARTADNRPIEVRLGIALLETDGRSAGVIVTEMDVPLPLLGVSALEALGFKVDPVEGRLEPTRRFPETPVL